MADNVLVDNGDLADYTVASEELTGGIHLQSIELYTESAGTKTKFGTSGNPVRTDPTGSTTQPVSGTVTANAGTGTFAVDQANTADIDYDSGAGTVNQAVMGLALPGAGGPVAGGTSTNPVRTDPTGTTTQPVSDGGGSLTVDGTVGVSGTVAVDSELTTADLDTGAGTDTRAVVGLVKAASGGGVLVSDANPLPISDAGGSVTVDGTVAVSGTVTVDSELTTADLDTGAGTDTRAVVGLALAASGGAVLAGAANPVPISDNSGSLTVDNGGTFAVQDSEKVTDNAAFTDGTTKVQPAGYVFDETAGTALTENDAAAARVDSKRAQVLVLEDETTRGRRATVTAANALKVDGSAVTQPVSGTVTAVASGDHTVVGKAADGAAVSGNPVLIAGQDGTNVQSLKTDANGELQVDVLTMPTVTVTDGLNVEGDVAHDGADSGNPVKQGAKAIAHGSNPTAVAAGDRTDLYANRAGIPFAIGGHPNVVTVEAAYTAAQTDVAIVTVASGLKIVVTSIAATLDEATTVGVGLRSGFGATTTPTTTGVVMTHPGLVPGGGFSRGDGSGILGIGADGEDLRITSEVPTTGSLRLNVSYYTVES